MSKQGIFISVAGDQEGATPRIVTENDSLPVHIAGVSNSIVNELFHHHTGTQSFLSTASNGGDVSIILDDAAGFVVNDHIQINNGVIETTFPQITGISVNTLTLDRPLDFGYEVNDAVEVVHADLRTDIGTLADPVSHKVQPEPGVIWHIERIIMSMTHSSAATDDKLGNLAGVANGVVFRAYIGGQYYTFTNWKTNRDIRLDMYDVEYTDKAGSSLFGTHARGSFNRIGVTVRLDGGNGEDISSDFLEVLVQDNLQSLTSFLINAQGHIGR